MKRKSFRRALIGAVLVAILCGYCGMRPNWEKVAVVTENNRLGGDFRIRGSDVISIDIREPAVTFKHSAQWKDPLVAEPTEPWMNDARESLNRETVSILRGTLDNGLTQYFRQPGQRAAWWYSKDWNAQYVATKWMDYRRPDSSDGLDPEITKLWRSSDGGKNWMRLKWPEDADIDRLLFLDAQRGYATGWGPHVWRTADGGQAWQEIALPPLIADASEPRRTLRAVDLGPDGMLRVAYYVKELGEVHASSVVFRLNWGSVRFEQEVALHDQVVIHLASSTESPGKTYSIFALSMLGSPRDYNDRADDGRRVGAISTWMSNESQEVKRLYAFDKRLRFDMHEDPLQVGSGGVLFLYGTSFRHDIPSDIDLVSHDSGRSWNEYSDRYIPGGYFDRETNTQYGFEAGGIVKRKF